MFDFEDNIKVKKSKIPYFFLAFFVVVFAVNLGYIYISKKTWSGLVTSDGYKKGLDYNETLKQEQEQQKLGWSVETRFTHNYEGSWDISFKLRDKNYRPIENATIFVNFKRPSDEKEDFFRRISFVDGVYKAQISFPSQGQWDIYTTVTAENKKFIKVERQFVKW